MMYPVAVTPETVLRLQVLQLSLLQRKTMTTMQQVEKLEMYGIRNSVFQLFAQAAHADETNNGSREADEDEFEKSLKNLTRV